MQQDTRHLTVAAEHMRSAHEEITLAQGQAERSIAEAAARRALDHLELACRRLDHERVRNHRAATGQHLALAYQHARQALQEVHGALNRWPQSASRALDPTQEHVLRALEALQAALGAASEEARTP